VDDFTVASSSAWTNAEPWAASGSKAAARLQIPYLFGYNKASGETKTWLHKKVGTLQAGGEPVQYSEYMLDLAYVQGTDGAKALPADDSGANSVDLDGQQAVAFAAEAVDAIDNVLPQKTFEKSYEPTISGNLNVKSKLTAKVKAWSPVATFTYQWFAGGKEINGATNSTLTLAAAQKGKKITVEVTGKAEGYTTITLKSKATAAVKAALFKKSPVPKIKGTAKVGKKLTVKVGTWSPKAKYTYKWYANGKVIKGATKASLTLKKAQKGKKITVKVTAKKTGYITTVKTSKKTAKVKK
jgi:phosphotransferase system HPr-like phosphotransfer protein